MEVRPMGVCTASMGRCFLGSYRRSRARAGGLTAVR
jgi:hypothetical protein